jgi:hypothetical protein
MMETSLHLLLVIEIDFVVLLCENMSEGSQILFKNSNPIIAYRKDLSDDQRIVMFSIVFFTFRGMGNV